jgi:hypothetical protein
MKLCIQSGHWNKSGSGAPQEQANNKRITDRVCAVLRQKGFEVYQTDYYAYNDPVVTKTDYSLFLALHCDMDYPNDGGSGFADYADPASDSATSESQRICKIINDTYFPEVKINYVNHSNKNTRFYYMWKYLTAKTPCVLLEMGQSIDPHDKVLLSNIDLITTGIVKSICKAFNVSYETTIPTPPIVDPKDKQISDLKNEINGLKDAQNKANIKFKQDLALKDIECQEKIKTYKTKIINFINSL